MAVPEFISILRNIRDVIYPAILTSEQNINNDKQSVEAVAGDLELIQTAADNALISEENAEASAESANLSKISASESELLASNSKDTAILKAQEASDSADEIKGIAAQAQTLVAGSQASATYNPVNGKFTFGIPQGIKGDKGEAFEVNAVGTFANRNLYDDQQEGFSYLSTNTGDLYFKLSSTTADWSLAIPFGKGDTGSIGDTGNGIRDISFLSTTDIGGLPAASGATDTYLITFTDLNTFDFEVYNGLDFTGDAITIDTDTASFNGALSINDTNVQKALDTLDGFSTDVQTALDIKQDTLVSGANIKTIQGTSLLGSGNIQIEGVPSGVITMWSGSISNIPAGWHLCNGSNGTPDLRNKFVYGASTDAEVKATGGSANAVNVAHSHSGSTNTTGNHSHSSGIYRYTRDSGSSPQMGKGYSSPLNTGSSGNHSHTVTVNSSGESGVGKNLPPYMKLAYIMKG